MDRSCLGACRPRTFVALCAVLLIAAGCGKQERAVPRDAALLNYIRASLLASSVNLYKAMGGGWVAIASDMTVSTGTPAPEHRAE